jgi:hypothetical protein
MLDAEGAVDLSPVECLDRLGSVAWGRLAVSMQAIAVVVPVPIMVLQDRVVFATRRGSMLDRAVHGQPVSVQAEGIHDGVGDGGDGACWLWSVVVSGVCAEEPVWNPAGWWWAQTSGVDGAISRVNAVPFRLVRGWSAPLPGDLISARLVPGRAHTGSQV